MNISGLKKWQKYTHPPNAQIFIHSGLIKKYSHTWFSSFMLWNQFNSILECVSQNFQWCCNIIVYHENIRTIKFCAYTSYENCFTELKPNMREMYNIAHSPKRCVYNIFYFFLLDWHYNNSPNASLHSKNTCVDHTQICVLQNTTLLSYMKDTHLCWFNTSTCVEMITQVLCDTCSNTPKNFLPPARGELTILCTTGECPIHWAITDTPYDDTISILIVTVVIMYIKVELLYINIFRCKYAYIEVN